MLTDVNTKKQKYDSHSKKRRAFGSPFDSEEVGFEPTVRD